MLVICDTTHMAIRTAEHNAKIGAANRARGIGTSPTKVCPRCKIELPRSSFAVRPNGYSESYCAECKRPSGAERSRRFWHNNPEYRARSRVTNRRATLKRYHGVTPEDYDRMYAAQNGVCAICGSASLQNGRSNLDIDHCHKTNVIRGLLCQRCNRAIGLFGDNADTMLRAVEYLRSSRWPDIPRLTK